jgi:hypothetical protein
LPKPLNQEITMAQPIVVQDATLRQFARSLSAVFTLPQWKYFVIVLLGLLHCDAAHTLSGLLRQVAITATLAGLSRFLTSTAWSEHDLMAARQSRFYAQVAPLVTQAHAQLRTRRPRRRGRPKRTVVTGYLIVDDSTHVKRYAHAMEGQGYHYSSSDKRTMPGHSLFQSVYLLLGRQLPLTPQMYRQQAVCEREGVAFHSKVDLAEQLVQSFEPPPETHTHVLIDTWYTNRRLWRAVLRRGWDITGGLKSNRQLRQVSEDGQRSWMSLATYATRLLPADFHEVVWPNQAGGEVVYALLVRTWVKKLGPCQVLIVKHTADAPASQARFWATNRCHDTLDRVVAAAAQRWAIEALFADFKELIGSDHYQVRSAQAITRFWALGLCVYQYLDEQRVQLQHERGRHVTLGEARAWIRDRQADHLLGWVLEQFEAGIGVDQIRCQLKPALA